MPLENDVRPSQTSHYSALLGSLILSCVLIKVARIALVSPQRSAQIESALLRMAQSGQLRGRIGEEQLIGLLEQVRVVYRLRFLTPTNRVNR